LHGNRKEIHSGQRFSRSPCPDQTPRPAGAVVIFPSYGGCKGEQLGPAWRVAETGLAACAIDLNAPDDVEAAIRHCRSFGKVTVIGHSMGGRLALLSSADAVIALSPAICPTYVPPIHRIIENWCYKVREPSKAYVFELLEKLPVWRPSGDRPTAIIHGSRDMPEIRDGCIKLKSLGVNATEIENALRSDIFLLEPTIEAVKAELAKIY
jgi:hypothetical protein